MKTIHPAYQDLDGVVYRITPIKGNKESVMVQRDPSTCNPICNLNPFATPIWHILRMVAMQRWVKY